MGDGSAAEQQRARVIEGFAAYAAAQSETGREFARRSRMHVTDSAAIVEILRAEDRGQPLTPARLAERVGLSSGATSILLNRLEDAGHVVRRRGHADRRLVTLHSTASVHESAAAFFDPVRVRLEEVLSHYTSEQLALVEHLVADVHAALETHLRHGNDDGSPAAPRRRRAPTAGSAPRGGDSDQH